MANPDDSSRSTPAPRSKLTSLEAQVAELRAALDEQRAAFTQVIDQQHAAITSLQQQIAPQRATPTTPQLAVIDSAAPTASHAPAASAENTENATSAPKRGTSRRGLLRGAAAATAAAAVATVAVGGAQSAHAAPLASGGNFILGQTNDADATTELIPTGGFNPDPLFRADNSSVSGISPAIQAFSQSVFGAVNAGASSGGTGIYANSDTGWAIQVAGGVLGSGRILQGTRTAAGAPTSGSYTIGEQIRDSNGEMWLCTANGSPGTWVRVAHVDAGGNGGAITFLSKPMRLLDTRGPGFPAYYSPASHSPLSPGDNRYGVTTASFNGVTIPANATGALGNVTVLNPSASGYLSIFPANISFPGTANLAFGPGQTLSNFWASGFGVFSLFLLHPDGIDVYISGATTDVIVDIFAYTV